MIKKISAIDRRILAQYAITLGLLLLVTRYLLAINFSVLMDKRTTICMAIAYFLSFNAFGVPDIC